MHGSRNIFQWGPGPTARKQSGQIFFFSQLILQFTEGVQWFITEKTTLFQGFRGIQHFPGGGGGVQLFAAGSKC